MPLIGFRDAAAIYITNAYDVITSSFGVAYLWYGFGLVIFLLWLAASRYGRITLGEPGTGREFSTPSWVAMIFTTGVGAGLMYWSVIEWTYYIDASALRPRAEVRCRYRMGRELERLVNVSRDGQLEIEPVIRTFLKRIKRDPSGLPVKLYPFVRKSLSIDEPAPVEIDPRVAFGRPVLIGRGVPTAVLADRFKAGDSLAELAQDYDTSAQDIEEAIRCELTRREAA